MLSPTTISDNGTGGAISQVTAADLYLMANVSAVPTGGAPTLDVYLQTSADGGTTWRDIAHLPQATTSTVKYFVQICGRSAGATTALTASDGALAANTVVQGPFGDRLRLKWAFAAGGSTGSYTLAASLILKF